MAEPTTYLDLIHTFTSFLTVAIHTILYERNIYPAPTFLSTRAYNFSVRQSRHPRVCKWILDAVSAVEAELLKGSAEKIAVVIYDPQDTALERFMFDVSHFPVVPAAEHLTPLERRDDSGEKRTVLPMGDLEEQMRAAMARLSGCGALLRPVPEGCSFTVVVELKEESEPPIGHPQAWIPVQPALQKTVRRGEDGLLVERGAELGGNKVTPLRSVAAGEMMFEMWIEEGKTKFEEQPASSLGSSV
ncbi:hypothetical protein MBLNU457_5377t1 [Dothideomycetes sp. NU457]